MAGPIALWDVPDTLRGRTWPVGRVAILGLVQVDHRCMFGWMAFGVVQGRILPCWSRARDLVDLTGAVSVDGSRRERDSCGSFVPALTEHSFSCRDFPKVLAPLPASPARLGLPVSPQFHTVHRHVEQSRRGTSSSEVCHLIERWPYLRCLPRPAHFLFHRPPLRSLGLWRVTHNV